MNTPPALSPTIYSVYGNQTDRRILLGFATGDIEDIKAFYDDRKAYGLTLEIVRPQHIPPGYADKRAVLLQEKENLKKALERINKEIKYIGG